MERLLNTHILSGKPQVSHPLLSLHEWHVDTCAEACSMEAASLSAPNGSSYTTQSVQPSRLFETTMVPARSTDQKQSI